MSTKKREGFRSSPLAGIEATLLDAVSAVDVGDWVEIDGRHPTTVHVKGITTATVKVHVSNNPTKPANSVHDVQIGSDVVADGSVEITAPYKWVKTRISAHTSGAISAFLMG